jgi:hypothetical protein
VAGGVAAGGDLPAAARLMRSGAARSVAPAGGIP